jgi:hypothetical protein
MQPNWKFRGCATLLALIAVALTYAYLFAYHHIEAIVRVSCVLFGLAGAIRIYELRRARARVTLLSALRLATLLVILAVVWQDASIPTYARFLMLSLALALVPQQDHVREAPAPRPDPALYRRHFSRVFNGSERA